MRRRVILTDVSLVKDLGVHGKHTAISNFHCVLRTSAI